MGQLTSRCFPEPQYFLFFFVGQPRMYLALIGSRNVKRMAAKKKNLAKCVNFLPNSQQPQAVLCTNLLPTTVVGFTLSLAWSKHSSLQHARETPKWLWPRCCRHRFESVLGQTLVGHRRRSGRPRLERPNSLLPEENTLSSVLAQENLACATFKKFWNAQLKKKNKHHNNVC